MAAKLTCREVQKMITPYLDDELGNRDNTAFITHINSCPACRRELETGFIVDYAVQYLDEDKIDDFDVHGLFEKKIREGKRRMARKQVLTALTWLGIIALGIVIAGILLRMFSPELYTKLTDPVVELLDTFVK